jgi:phage-related holin
MKKLLSPLSLILFLSFYILSYFPNLFNYTIKITENNYKQVYSLTVRLLRFINFYTLVLFLTLVNQTISAALNKTNSINSLLLLYFIVGYGISLIVYLVKLNKLK